MRRLGFPQDSRMITRDRSKTLSVLIESESGVEFLV